MGISDKTRKILWGRSGNRCAICQEELIFKATQHDKESIVGEECHIISSQHNGPRYDPEYPQDKINSYENLILLCRTHHKMVDDQNKKYTVEDLCKIKNSHEKWVSEKLEENQKVKIPKIKRIKQNIPKYLTKASTGKEVLNITESACACSFSHDELTNNEEVDFVGEFSQLVLDWSDILGDVGVKERVRCEFELTKHLRTLE